MSKPSTLKRWYFVKKPAEGSRATFALIEVDPTTKKSRTLRDPRLAQVNRDLLSGVATPEQCADRAGRVLEGYREKERPARRVHLSENMAVLQEYWDTDYAFRDLPEKTRRGMWRRLERAVLALGKVSLRTGAPDQVHRQLVSLKLPPSIHNEYVSRLQQLLKYASNAMKVPRKPEPGGVPAHVTEQQLLARMKNAPEPVRSYAGLLFYSGIRASEAFDLTSASYQGDNALFVETQLSYEGEVKAPKRGSIRHAFIFDDGVEYFRSWITNNLRELRTTYPWAEKLREHLGVEDSYMLRHSYALHCIAEGVDEEWVIRSMGTSREVFRRHYGGKVHTKSTIQAMAAFVRDKKKPRP